jgi:hypothetical protein
VWKYFTIITVAHFWLFHRPVCKISILVNCIAIRMKKVCYARGCYNSDTPCDKFFRFPRNPQR